MDEPITPNSTPRPFSTPHSAPIEWLHACPELSGGAAAEGEADPRIDPAEAEAERSGSAIDLILSNPSAIGELIARAAPDDVRADGWTPFCRRLFLQVLAETGRVSTACEYTRLSKQSAYALRARDPLFAAGWDAASELARAQLADALYEKALDGVSDTITKDGEVVAVRHRFDSRLSTAVLARLDRRCDRAEERGSKHLALVQRWDDVIGMIGRGEDDAAIAILEAGPQSAQHRQPSQLPDTNSPTADKEEVERIHLWDRCWKDEDGVWMTDFPPPPGFTGYQSCEWNDPDRSYKRKCSSEEAELLDADDAAAEAEERADEERLRNEWFERLRTDLLRTERSATGAAALQPGECKEEPGNPDAPSPPPA
jgi:hypothetical protein